VAKPAEKVEDEISIRRSEIPVPRPDGTTDIQVYITYSTRDLPPGLITLPKKEWSEAKEKELIKKDLTARRAARPTTVRI